MNQRNFDPNAPQEPGGLPAVSLTGTAAATAGGSRYPALRDPGLIDGYADNVSFSTQLRKYSIIARKHWALVLGVCVAALAIGFVVTFVTTPAYRATATIQIDREAAKVVKVEDTPDITVDSGDNIRFYQTQNYLLKTRSLAAHVVDNLDLADAPDFLAPKSKSPWALLEHLVFGTVHAPPASFAARQDQAIDEVEGGLSVAPVGESRLVKLSFDSPSPEWAQRVVNGVAVNFIKDNLDRRYAATKYARTFLAERLEDLKLKLQDAEKKLVEYAAKKEILTGDPDKSLANADMTALNAAVEAAKVERIRTQKLWEQAEATAGLSVPQVLANSTIETLLNQRAVLAAQYQQKLSQFKPDYPDMQTLKAQIQAMDHEIGSAASVIKNSLNAQYEAALHEEQSLEQQMSAAKAGVLNLQNESIEYNILKREADTSRTLYNGLLQQYKDVGVAGAVGTNNISIIDAATVPGAPFSPSLTKNLGIALLLGLVVSLMLATLLEILDDTFKSPEEIEDALGLAMLGVLPSVSGDVVKQVTESPRAVISEACRSLRTALQFSTESGIPKNIFITSARPGDGKSTISMALAINLAQLGLRVLLIDADLRKGGGTGDLDEAGLSNILAGDKEPSAVIAETKIPGLSFIGAGPLPPNPAELLGGPRMVQLITDAAAMFDVTVLDGAPVMGLADAPLLASMASATILVVAAGEGRRGAVNVALRRLQFARARIIGAVLNKFDSRKVRVGEGYGYGYGYAYAYSDAYGYHGYGAELEHHGTGAE
jgi:capsular exopolysaccharide synthesis family protein